MYQRFQESLEVRLSWDELQRLGSCCKLPCWRAWVPSASMETMESVPEEVGRNEPCPCGSGKKWKHCHGRPDAADRGGADYRAARESALAKLLRFSQRDDLREHFDRAQRTFWGARLLDPGERLDELMEIPNVLSSFSGYVCVDFAMADGTSLVARFLERRGRELSSLERAYIEALARTWVGIYEIVEVIPEQGFVLRDLWRTRTLQVKERSLTSQLRPFQLVAARLIENSQGKTEIEDVWAFAAQHKKAILDRLERAQQDQRDDGNDERRFFRSVSHLFHHLWLELVAEPPRPQLVTAGGEPFVLCTSSFDVHDRAQLETALAADQAFEPDDGEWGWKEDVPGRAAFQRTLGRLRIEKGLLELETQSKERAARGRALLEQLAPGAVTFRRTTTKSVEQMLGKHRAEPPDDLGVPEDIGDEGRALLRDFLDQHYRTWPDHPLPALEGRTPRAVAKTEPHRVVQILKEFESTPNPQVDYDFGWLWQELGLERPRTR